MLRCLLLAVCIAAAVYLGIRTGRHLGVRTAPAAKPRLTVVFTGEDLGRLEPCGCTPAMLGGLARRPARIEASREPGVPTVYVSGGNLVEGSGEYDRMRLRVILRVLASTGCAAYAPSMRDLELGRGDAAYAARDVGVAFASTVAPPVVEPLQGTVAAAADGIPVRVVGIADAAGRGDVRRRLLKVRGALPAGAPLVALTDFPGVAAASSRVADVGGPTLVLVTAGITDPRDSDATGGPVAVAPYPAHGKYVGLAHLYGEGDDATWVVEYRPVLHDLPEDPAIVRMKTELLDEMRAADFVAKSSRDARFAVGDLPAGDDLAGGAACADCHPSAARAWKDSRHSHAMESLRATGDDADPGCVRCHVVGYGREGGFVSPAKTPQLADVGCEACHGPHGDHAKAHREHRPATNRPPAGERSCAGCHDGEHNPEFDFTEAWPRIAHGAK
jgi:hypothetical protein